MTKVLLGLLLSLVIIKANGQIKESPIEIADLSVKVNSGKFTATTEVNIEFFNPNEKILDGEFSFSLQSGQVITGFALDINGFLREGVIVEKQEGRVAYENTIRRRIDPGLLEMTGDNRYRIRIYPMPVRGTRKIRLQISQILAVENDMLQYHLPFDSILVKRFQLDIKIPTYFSQPRSKSGVLEDKSFHLEKDSFSLKLLQNNLLLNAPLAFAIPIRHDEICVTNQSGKTSFAIRVKPVLPVIAPPSIQSATIFWDASGSAARRDLEKEIQYLDRFCEQKGITQLNIVVFSNDIREEKKFAVAKGISSSVKRYLQNIYYDGGTRLDQLDCTRYSGDAFLLFSDGVANYGAAMIKTDSRPVYCINSSPLASHEALTEIAAKNGRYFDLSRASVNDAIAQSGRIQNKLVQLRSENESVTMIAGAPLLFDQWITLTGEVSNPDSPLELVFGDLGVEQIKRVSLTSSEACNASEVKLMMAIQYLQKLQKQKDESALMGAARNGRFVTAFSSFIVLDNIEDYIAYGIEPSPDLQDEYNKRLIVVKKMEQERKLAEENAVINNLLLAVGLYNDRINWWDKSEKKISLIKNPATESKSPQNGVLANSNSLLPDVPDMANSLSEVVVVGYGSSRRMSLTGSVSTFSSNQILPGAANLEQVLAGRIAGVYVQQSPSSPGSAITIRGYRSLAGSSDPLYVIDGIYVTPQEASALPAGLINNILVLKDAQASALYGSRASNGAIVITTTRSGSSRNSASSIPKYSDLDDVDYVARLREEKKFEIYQRYLQMKPEHQDNPAFFIDAAQILMEAGDRRASLRVLTNLLEIDNENHQLLRAVGYVLENWMMYDEAVQVYQKVLQIKEEEPQSYRDLAIAYERSGQYQQAVDLLYKALTKNWFQYEGRYRGFKSLLLNEMNGIIARHRNVIDTSAIQSGIIKPLPVDLRIVIDWNKDETDIDLHIVEPGGSKVYYGSRYSQSGGRLSEDFTQGYGPEEYQIKSMQNGKYSIRVNYFGDRVQKVQTPTVIKLTIFKNFGRPDQTVSIQTMVMDNQTGIVEIGSVR